ncbi:hypothetical protein [Actinomadura sp. NTSP31]|uniref:hypothetical protein n=1 Tax=Actinomadura sp. NTSP31 TaxID=1735447 RepID=UPI0035BFAE06
MRRFPSRRFDVNAAWLELSLAATDLLTWARLLLPEGGLATAEPKKLRCRLLHIVARLTRGLDEQLDPHPRELAACRVHRRLPGGPGLEAAEVRPDIAVIDLTEVISAFDKDVRDRCPTDSPTGSLGESFRWSVNRLLRREVR